MLNQNFHRKIRRFPFFHVWYFITTPLIKKTLFEKFLNSIGNLYVSSGRYILQWICWNNAFYSTDYFFLADHIVDKQKSTWKTTLL